MRRPHRSTPSRRPTFLLGTGAQKAGTTWLSRYLQVSPEFDRGYRKEYHVLDTRHLASEPWLRERLVDEADASLRALARGEDADAGTLHRASMVADPAFYFDWFAGLVHRDGPVRATGDLTPEHALLPAEQMSAVRDAFAERGVRTVAVFLLRDPVDRVWSQIRMRAANTAHGTGSTVEQLRHEHGVERFAVRTRYHETLRALGEAFAPDEVHVALYESMFADTRLTEAVSRLVGITFRRPTGLKRLSNNSPKDVAALPDDVARTVAEHYAETYREVARLRPDLDVGRWWPHARWVL